MVNKQLTVDLTRKDNKQRHVAALSRNNISTSNKIMIVITTPPHSVKIQEFSSYSVFDVTSIFGKIAL